MKEKWSDNELAAAAAEGDMEAFTVVVTRYQDRICGFLSRLLLDYHRAQDLAQETFLRVYRRLRGGGPEEARKGNFRSLLFTIARNLGCDELRKRKRHGEIRMVDAHGSSAPASDPAVLAMTREKQEAVWQALDGLPEDARALLIWHEIEGMPYEQIARTLSIPLGTVKSRINRARMAFSESFTRIVTVSEKVGPAKKEL